MNIKIDTSIKILGNVYSPLETKSEKYKDTRTNHTTYLYIIDKNTPDHEIFTVYVSHFSDSLDLFAFNVRKGIHNMAAYDGDEFERAMRKHEFAGELCVEVSRLEKTIEEHILEYLRYSNLEEYVKNILG